MDRSVTPSPGPRSPGRPREFDAALTARPLLCVVQGMRVLGKTGGSREEMASLVDSALKLLD